MFHQQALGQVQAQAAMAQSHVHMQDDHQQLAITTPGEPLVQQPSFVTSEALDQQVAPSASDSRSAQKETSDISHTDKKYQLSSLANGKPADDGYNWRKYGQKQVKGSEYPKSYYKCTHPNCQVKKMVERAPDGHITEIVYNGQHNHEVPLPNRHVKENSNLNGNISIQVKSDFTRQGWVGNSNKFSESVTDHSVPETDPSSNQGAYMQLPGSSESEEGGDADIREEVGDVIEPNPKRGNTDLGASEVPMSHKTITEPKIIVQTRSEVDLLDDGYRKRKYGQKRHFGLSHQRALGQVQAQAVMAQSHMHMQGDHQQPAVTAPGEPLVQQPSFVTSEALDQQVAPSASDSRSAQKETSDISQIDKNYQLSSLASGKPSDDGYNWCKYGQKQVKGSEYPTNYYKCTHLNCQVKKKVEHARDGQLTEIIYKGQHNHEVPRPNKRIKDNSDLNGNTSVQVKSVLI